MAEEQSISRRELIWRAGIGAGGIAGAGAAAPRIWAAPRLSEANQTLSLIHI